MDKKLPNKILSKVVLSGLKWYLGSVFSINLEENDTIHLTPPYLIIGNHANFWDGFLVNLFVKDPISFLVSDEYFRKKFLGWLLRFEGSIPKKKFLADFSAVKETLEAKKEGRIIGIFPEGKRNWDGTTEDFIFATTKLIKMLKIPVVRVLLKGSYLSFPRWAQFKRKGKISLSYDLILTSEEVCKQPTEAIYEKMENSLSYQEYSYQRKAMNPYYGRNLAERLELYLFLCPNCHQIGTLRSKGDILTCIQCHYQLKYDQYGFFKNERNSLYFDNPADWNRWQINWIKEELNKNFKKDHQEVFIKDQGVNLIRIDNQHIVNSEKGCKLYLKGKELILEKEESTLLYFEIDLIKGINVQYNDQFEFYYHDQLYRFYFDDPSISAYKWYKIIKLAQSLFLS